MTCGSVLLGATGWWRLPPAVCQRFSKRLTAGASVTYAGEIVESRRTHFGNLLAQLCRSVGAPLPLYDDVAVPAVVTVIEDGATGGQFWTRMYGRARGFPRVIHSNKQVRRTDRLGGVSRLRLRHRADGER
jgi:hypothetical protein